ncbi:MAG: hypothetical protein JOY87_01295 [Candidatus Eremiobacteraeota bacterium]|nr:hypothetical protein [Candidatus Eremiobacteraeota bacterium]
MQKLHHYADVEIEAIIRQEGWDRPLAPVHRVQLSGWFSLAFWGLRIYVAAMLAVVGYAFFHTPH